MPKPCTVTLNLDWNMLRDQKLRLLELSNSHPILDGVIHMIDDIQDTAFEQGCPVKWLEDHNAND